MTQKPKIAVVFSGCGKFDGSEIHEAVCALLGIEKHGGEYECFAPNGDQHDVVNHMTQEAVSETRNMLVEAARLAPGKVRDLKELDPNAFDAVVFPGGFGAAKNLSTFVADGADCTVNEEVAGVITAFHGQGKPIGALCIASAVMAKVLGAVEVTVGPESDASAAVEKMGATHKVTGHGEIVVDARNKLVTTPCYMLESTLLQVAEGVENAMKAVIDLATA